MRLVLVFLAVAFTSAARAEERILLPFAGGDPPYVELFLAKPEGEGPWPLIVFVHGHQSAPRPGARVFIRLDRRPVLATVDEGRLEHMRQRGYVAAAVSLAGYGDTPGPSDFWGPRAHASLEAALRHLIDLPFVDRDRVAVYGVSGGAATASVVATRFGGIRALILVAGVYDVGELYPTGEPGMDRQIEQSAGTSPEAFAARAALRWAERITASTLVLHGALDRDVTREQARRLAARLRAAGVPVRERIYGDTGHQIPIPAQWEEIDPFLREVIGR